MAVITISRGTFSGGTALASCLAANLGYRLLSREVLLRAAAAYGVCEDDLLCGMERAPTLLERFRVDRQMYLAAVTATLCRAAREDHVVYHGNAGHLLLAGIDHVLRVRVVAPMRLRVATATTTHGFEAGEAEGYIRRKDAERVAWTRFLYGVEWSDPALYDLVANLEALTLEAVCQSIACLVERPRFRATPERTRALDDRCLANHLRAVLFRNPAVAAAAAGVAIEVHEGGVRLAGLIADEHVRDEIVATVTATPGVVSLDAEMLGAGSVSA